MSARDARGRGRALAQLFGNRAVPAARGITSVCSGHPLVIGAALLCGKAQGAAVLSEATCNQVNHQGGYTGMTPAQFRRFVAEIAARVGFDPEHLILGGDHLGPNPWRKLSSAHRRRCRKRCTPLELIAPGEERSTMRVEVRPTAIRPTATAAP
jgi:D-tagatose-1,6-bisphosphate aldolase subunit GatZ/KbaZ